MTQKIDDCLKTMLEETKTVTVPYFMKNEAKKERLASYKSKIDTTIYGLINDFSVEIDDIDSVLQVLWDKAEVETEEEFQNIRPNRRLSSFYFQEILSRYVVKIRERLNE